MESKISLKDIYQQNLNFIIGAGASSGLFPTLWLDIEDSEVPGQNETIETLATKLEQGGLKHHHALLFMHYYQKIIKPVISFSLDDTNNGVACDNCNSCEECNKRLTLGNYETFLESLILLLIQKDSFSRRCNIFTTNYDGCMPLVADKILESGKYDFVINDGSRGFLKRTLAAKNFNSYVCQTGVFGRNSTDIPQIGLVNLHGSAYWRKSGDNILIDYNNNDAQQMIPDTALDLLEQLSNILNDESKTTADVIGLNIEFSDDDLNSFWDAYNKLPIVNPTKWKFHETVFEEHYYQMLRMLSYELEKPNSVLISFAFSFADEHILNLVKRSLSNPKLTVYICCFNEGERAIMQGRFNGFRNVQLINLEGENLDFTKFNSEVFNADSLRDSES